ncbi:MAG: hypothetical protein WD278_17820 [Pirellulales bacterium]
MAPSLLPRLVRSAASLFGVVAAYWVYAQAAVPLIEPVAVRPHSSREQGGLGDPRANVKKQRQGLELWFDEGQWQRSSPKIVETPQGKLLFKDYRNLEDGRHVKLEPCTMIFLPRQGIADEQQRQRRAIILDAPQGAILEFDEKFDLKRGKVGKLIGGRLVGDITIQSMQRLEGPEDDLRISTRDVVLDEESITSVHPIDFRLGPNRGSGRGLRMDLARDKSEAQGGGGVGSVASFELASHVRMLIHPGGGDFFPGATGQPSAGPKPPVEIRCRGPFRFDLREYVATFRDDVDVLRIQPTGPSDQLTCQTLDVRFEAEDAGPDEAAAAGGTPSLPKLRPSQITAIGNPVVVNSPSNKVRARGQRLEYDVNKGSGKLSGQHEVSLVQEGGPGGGTQEIHARALYFEPDPNDRSGRLGVFLASGAGWLKADMPSQPAQHVDARWTHSLHFRPHEENQLLSVKGEAKVHLPASGALSADEIHLWLNQQASAAAAPGWFTPDRLLARGAVRIESPQLDGAVQRLEVWFVHAAPRPVAPAGPPPSAAAGIQGDRVRAPATRGPALNAAAQSLPQVSPIQGPPVEAAAVGQRFRIAGELLQLEVGMGGEKPQIRQLIVDRRVRCEETKTLHPGEQPLVLVGDRLHMIQGSSSAALAKITGQPARVDARGLALLAGTADLAGTIHLDQAANMLWIHGEGSLSLPAGSTPVAPGAAANPLQVTWQGQMDFDGRTARFLRAVVASQHEADPKRPGGRHERLMRTESLDVRLLNHVRFDAAGVNDRPAVDSIVCTGGAYVENRSLEGQRQTALMRMKARDLTIVERSGDVTAQGPGWLTNVSWDGLESLAGGNPRGRSSSAASKNDSRLSYLDVHFDREMRGNLVDRVMRFHQNVRAVYGPVADWEGRLDPDKPERLGREGFVLNCDQLQVAQMGVDAAGNAAYEMTAEGSTVVEGEMFLARALWLRYAMAKGLLTLEGDGKTDARLSRQTRVGGVPSDLSARKIQYWPATGHAIVEDFGSADLSDLTGIKLRR